MTQTIATSTATATAMPAHLSVRRTTAPVTTASLKRRRVEHGHDFGHQPLMFEHLTGHVVPEEQEIPKRVRAARYQLLVGARQHLDGKVGAGRVARMREGAAGGHVNAVDPCLHEPLAHLNGIAQDIP